MVDYRVAEPPPGMGGYYRQGVNRTPSGKDIYGNPVYDTEWIEPGFEGGYWPGSGSPDPLVRALTGADAPSYYSGKPTGVGLGTMWGSGPNATPPTPDVRDPEIVHAAYQAFQESGLPYEQMQDFIKQYYARAMMDR